MMMNQVELPPPVAALGQGCSSIAVPSSSEYPDTIYVEPSPVAPVEGLVLSEPVQEAALSVRALRSPHAWGVMHLHELGHFQLRSGLPATDAIEVQDLQSADTIAAVVASLRRRSLDRTADRVAELAASDHDEPGQPEIAPD